MPLSIYLDTNAIIRFIEEQDDGLRWMFVRLGSQGARFLTSEISLAETLVRPLQDGMFDVVTAYETLLTAGDLIEAVPIDTRVLRRSAELRATLGGKLPDTVHVATAELTGCGVVLSSDKGLRLPGAIKRVSVEDAKHLQGPS